MGLYYGGLLLIKYTITVGGLIAIFIICFYIFGIEPTQLELNRGDFIDKNLTKLNQSGKTEPYSTVTINGEAVVVDANGNFYKVMNVKNGVHVVTVTAKAPFKSQSQLNVTTNRTEDEDGILADVWSNSTVRLSS